MRTERVWAIARADGSVEVGVVPTNRLAKLPIVRVLTGLVGALKLGIVRGMLRRGAGGSERVRRSRRLNGRFLVAMALAEGLVIVLARLVEQADAPGWTDTLVNLLPWIVVLAVLRVATPAVLWRYHGAEHKAVAAHEQGVDLSDTAAVLACPRVHNRCGTNLVFVMALASLALLSVPGVFQVPMFALSVGVSVELVSLASSRPRRFASRAVLAGGRFLQRTVTTAEPTFAEQAVGCAALQAALAEHARIVAAEAAPAAVPVAA
jgi:uncharacterized protein YqhQ